MSKTQPTPEHILQTTAAYFNLPASRVKAMRRPNYNDHADGVPRASKIAQALMVEICEMTFTDVARWMGRAETTVRGNWTRINKDVRTDLMLARDVGRIVRAL